MTVWGPSYVINELLPLLYILLLTGRQAFLWPPDRIWDAQHDNTAPCGSSAGPSNRTIFPLSQGAVALSIADEAWHVAFRLAVSDSKTLSSAVQDRLTNPQTQRHKQTSTTRL